MFYKSITKAYTYTAKFGTDNTIICAFHITKMQNIKSWNLTFLHTDQGSVKTANCPVFQDDMWIQIQFQLLTIIKWATYIQSPRTTELLITKWIWSQ